MPRIGLLGGSFDPVHLAHLALAQAALTQLHLAGVQFIPAAQPWQRRPLQASEAQRLDMLRLTLAGQDRFSINTSELDRGGPTYTIDTIRQLPAGVRYVWLLGTDQLVNFCTWRDWQDIIARIDLAVAQRPGSALAPPPALAAALATHGRQLEIIPFTPRQISASDIRARQARGESLQDLVAPAVADYINAHGLYREAGHP
ncbi:nicotinate (nicotinamide) nucleotide adenylyltransferase [Kerstersia similis]|uniref:nicotinate (nicotinamide) nucleotide adenylyltransferase n=1 Tax=Kerstersia similis TaxID=206505 RepID=UPI0039EF1D4C